MLFVFTMLTDFLLGVAIGCYLMMSKIDNWRDGWCDCCAYKIFYLQSIESPDNDKKESDEL